MAKEKLSAVFFDSGIGGLNLLCKCAVRAPRVHYYYISDSDNVPYGNKSSDEIFALAVKSLEVVGRLNPSALVIACNTVTAQCVQLLRNKYPFPVIGIQPEIKQAAKVGKNCLVLATAATLSSASYRRLAAGFSGINIIENACNGLAHYIENNVLNLPETLPEGLLPEVVADSVVLGCTHYTYIEKQIFAKYKCTIFDGLNGTSNQFLRILGIINHSKPPAGNFIHLNKNMLNITYLSKNAQKNKVIFEKLLQNEL